MQMEDFERLWEQKEKLSLQETRELGAIVARYPYFQTARVLHLKALRQSHSFFYNSALKKTAAYTADRSVLFDYITSDQFLQDAVSSRIKERGVSNDEETGEETVLMDEETAEQVLDPDLFGQEEENTGADDAAAGEYRQASKEESSKKSTHIKTFEPGALHSFSEWLKFTAAESVSAPSEKSDATREERPEKKKMEAEREHQNQIIDRFIETSPKISPSKTVPALHIPKQDLGLEERLMTETLAEIYVDQHKYDKAIQAYRILILKNPEKSSLFADRIEQIENLKEK